MTDNIDTLNNRRTMFGNGERDYSVDVMRSLSCLMVVAIHASSMSTVSYPYEPMTSIPHEWYLLEIIKCSTVSATNLFLMISGIFFLSPERNVNLTKLWSKNILKLACAYVLWSVIYALLRIYYFSPREFEWEDFIHECITQEVHLWYIPMMLGIYMLVPFMRYFTERAERKHYLYMISLMIGAMTLNTVLLFNQSMDFKYDDSIATVIGFTPVDMICQYPFYCILGYFIYTYPPKLKTRILIYFLGILGMLFTFASSITVHYYAGGFDPGVVQGKFAIGVLAKNTALFIFVITIFSKVKMSHLFKKVISKLSAATLFIYLFHMVSIRVLFKNEIFFVDGLATAGTAIKCTLVTYVAGFLISLIFLQLIPWVRMRNAILDAVWPNRKIWNGGRRRKPSGN